ncbi:hypothetical protein M6B38_266990 [Iris pallida]|uniref:Uncharacterized protein n=1 Tax=Iris pallida TaxID=29817 RepID=A0AAX6I967_IRIPA|nr:hypothetical protein M6B38_266990 [Iris pallida]
MQRLAKPTAQQGRKLGRAGLSSTAPIIRDRERARRTIAHRCGGLGRLDDRVAGVEMALCIDVMGGTDERRTVVREMMMNKIFVPPLPPPDNGNGDSRSPTYSLFGTITNSPTLLYK